MSVKPRTGIQLAVPFSESRLLNNGRYGTKWTPPYILQPKLNGERCRMIVTGGRCLLLSSTEEIISSVPHINEQGKVFPDGEYDGELYVHGMTFSEIHSIVSRTSTMHPQYMKMELHLFDLMNNSPQYERLLKLRELRLRLGNCIKLVRLEIAQTPSQIMNLYDSFIKEGYEGFIIRQIDSPYVRKRSSLMMKFKPKETDTYIILDLFEAISESGQPLGMVGKFFCMDDMKTPFKVGAGKLSHMERKLLWEKYLDSPYSIVGHLLEVEYQTMSDKNHVPLFSRAVRIISSCVE